VTFEVADLEDPALSPSSLDLVVSSNTLEHLSDPRRFLNRAHASLASRGRALLALPPITFAGAMSQHERIHYHRSTLPVDKWLDILAREGWGQAVLLAHRYAADSVRPDFTSHHPSRLSSEGFSFEPTTRDAIYADPPITAIFSLGHGAT